MSKAKKNLFKEESLSFLKLAGKQKNPEWIIKNQIKYEQLIKDPINDLAVELKFYLSEIAEGYHFPQRSIGRIKRASNRIAPGQALYKDWVSYIVTTPSESRFEKNPLLFFGLLPNDPDWDGVVVAGGLYNASSAQMSKVRRAIAKNSKPFKDLFADKEFKKSFKTSFNPMVKAKKCPRGFDENHPDIEWIKLKTFFVSKSLDSKQYTSAKLAINVANDFKQLLRLNKLLQDAIDGKW